MPSRQGSHRIQKKRSSPYAVALLFVAIAGLGALIYFAYLVPSDKVEATPIQSVGDRGSNELGDAARDATLCLEENDITVEGSWISDTQALVLMLGEDLDVDEVAESDAYQSCRSQILEDYASSGMVLVAFAGNGILTVTPVSTEASVATTEPPVSPLEFALCLEAFGTLIDYASVTDDGLGIFLGEGEQAADLIESDAWFSCVGDAVDYLDPETVTLFSPPQSTTATATTTAGETTDTTG